MEKTDNRHYNRRANRELSIEMDLWLRYSENGNKTITLQKAVSGVKNTNTFREYELSYNPVFKNTPFVIQQITISDSPFNHCFVSMPVAKRALKRWNFKIKWITL